MRTSIGTAAAVALTLLTTACTGGGPAPGSPSATAPQDTPATLGAIKLVAYDSCAEMLEGLRAATAEIVGPWGLGGPVTLGRESMAAGQADAKAAAPAHSTTNVHEAGADEPDLVKTDGERIVTITRGVLRVVDAATRKITGTLRLLPQEQEWVASSLLLSGDRALVILGEGSVIPLGAMAKRPAAPASRLVLVDLAEMKELGSLSPAGAQVDVRMTGSTARVVVRSQPVLEFPEGRPDDTEQERLTRNKKVVAEAPIEAWLPSYEVTGADGTTRTERVPCERVSHPQEYTGASMITVHSVDLAASIDGGEPISVAADGDTVYSTPTSLYVTSNPHWRGAGPVTTLGRPLVDVIPAEPRTAETSAPLTPADPGIAKTSAPIAPKAETSPPAEKVEPSNDPSMPSLLPETAAPSPPSDVPPATGRPSGSPEPVLTPGPTEAQAPPERTEVHRFDLSASGAPRYTGSGEVPGHLLNQYSLSEHDGHLRVATTSSGSSSGVSPGTADGSSSGVYVLKTGTLERTGEVTGLGKGERIYSVRFIGAAGYVVTFRQTDPLYTLDLSDPARPRATGELKITGFSSYLHPAGDGRLLGIGQEASDKGQIQGTQISLFDVTDPAEPKRLARFHQKESSSEAENEPHAFFYWPATQQAVVPLNSWNGDQNSALVLKVGAGSLTEQGTITHPVPKQDDRHPLDPRVRRTLIVGDTLWTVSDNGLKASDPATLDEQGWVPFT